MHLLNTNTLALESINGQSPPYAILSHRWREGEVLFEDVQPGAHAETKAAYKKLRMACTQALADGFHYLWIDTCCIDKSSSAELSEAINSMFTWYSDAQVCYAYLDDVPDDCDVSYDGEIDVINSSFGRSEWFRRGWTLQELVAPRNLTFYSQGWVELGRKSTLATLLAKITGIDEDVLTGYKSVRSCSVARRMSWASKRETTRKEDEAYCLMGLFDVNMPMLYGEGAKAFIRLQEEIMKETDDETLFAWIDKDASPDSLHGLLAKRPAHFADSGHIVPFHTNDARHIFAKTNRGIQITLPAVERYGLWEATLNCPNRPLTPMSIFLKDLSKDLSNSGGGRQAARTHVNTWFPFEESHQRVSHGNTFSIVSFYVRQNLFQRESAASEYFLRFGNDDVPRLRTGHLQGWWIKDTVTNPSVADIIPPGCWTSLPIRSSLRMGEVLVAVIIHNKQKNKEIAILLGLAPENGKASIGIDVVSCSNKKMSFFDFQSAFKYKSPPFEIDLGYAIVRVAITRKLKDGKCYFCADIYIV